MTTRAMTTRAMTTRAMTSRGLLLAALAGLPGGWCLADEVTSTRQLALPVEWSVTNRWNHDVPGVTTFPNNGNEGHTFDVVIPNILMNLDVPVTIDNLQIMGGVTLNDRSLDVLETIDASFCLFDNGNVTANRVEVSSNVTLRNSNLQTSSLLIEGNANVTLENVSKLTVDGAITFVSNGDILSLSGIIPEIEVKSGLIQKVGGNSASDITARMIANEVTLRQSSQSGVLRFVDESQIWGGLTAEGEGLIDFSAPLTVGDTTVSMEGQGQVLFRGETVLTGTLTTMLPEGETTSFGVLFDGFNGPATLSGGVLNGRPDAPITFDQGSIIGNLSPVRNIGHMVVEDAIVFVGGLRNEGMLVSPSQSGNFVVDGSMLENASTVTTRSSVKLANGARIRTEEGATWFGLDGAGVFPLDDPDPLAEFRSLGTLDFSVLEGTSRIGVPFHSSGMIRLGGSRLRLLDVMTLENVSIEADAGGVFVEPDDSALGGEFRLVGDITLVREESSDSTLPVLNLEKGDVSLVGRIIAGGQSGPVRGSLAGTASLSGGVLDIRGSSFASGFWQSGGVIAKVVPVRNDGRFTLFGGRVGPEELHNTGEMRVQTGLFDDAVIGNLRNTGTLDIEDARPRLEGVGIRNEFSMNFDGGSEFLVESGTPVLTNTGTMRTGLDATISIEVDVDTPGRVVAANGIFTFRGGVAQLDVGNRTLTGGTFEVVGTGQINFPGDLRIHELMQTNLNLDDVEPPGLQTWSEMERLGGELSVTGDTTLDLTSNENGGELDVEFDGDFSGGDIILRPGTGSRLVVTGVNNRGTVNVFGTGTVEASSHVTLLEGGRLQGDLGTTVTPILDNVSGVIAPGQPSPADVTGTVNVQGDLAMGNASALELDLGGESSDEFDRVVVTGHVTLGGTLDVTLAEGFEPQAGSTFEVVVGTSISGSFDSVSVPDGFEVVIDSTVVRLVAQGPCAPDANGDTVLDIFDVLDFLALFSAGDAGADWNGDTVLDIFDVLLFLGDFEQGC